MNFDEVNVCNTLEQVYETCRQESIVVPLGSDLGLVNELKQKHAGKLNGLCMRGAHHFAMLKTLDAGLADILASNHKRRPMLIRQPESVPSSIHECGVLDHASRFKIFCTDTGDVAPLSGLHSVSPVALDEFIASSIDRLEKYPVLRPGSRLSGTHGTNRRLVFVIDLVQDFEILKPLMIRACLPGQGITPVVIVTEKTSGSYYWPTVKQFLTGAEIEHHGVSDYLQALPILDFPHTTLITASESDSTAHAFNHKLCKTAPLGTLRITMQHGYENIGLRHHNSHSQSFKYGIRFASDIVLTWDSPHALPDIHPMETDKCISVGVIKNLVDSRTDRRLPSAMALPSTHKPHQTMIAENLHSVRFSNQSRFNRFFNFLSDMHSAQEYGVRIRSHPAIRKLQTSASGSKFAFVDGPLTMTTFQGFDIAISPPSTFILDCVISGTPVAAWSDNPQFGDLVNYQGLPHVCDVADFEELIRNYRIEDAESAFSWAVASTSALNGIPFAWNTIMSLAN
jgi:hypothetical protein